MGPSEEVRRVDLANCAFRISPKFTSQQGLNISSIRVFFDLIRDPEIPITLRSIFKYEGK